MHALERFSVQIAPKLCAQAKGTLHLGKAKLYRAGRMRLGANRKVSIRELVGRPRTCAQSSGVGVGGYYSGQPGFASIIGQPGLRVPRVRYP